MSTNADPASNPLRSVPTEWQRFQSLFGILAVLAILTLAYRAYAPHFETRPCEARCKPVNLNCASRSELLQLPGVGANLADAIITHRVENRFDDVEQLDQVPGIGPKTVELLRSHVSVGPLPNTPLVEQLERKPTPASASTIRIGKMQPGEARLDVNTASAADFQRLPRIGPVLATAIVQARDGKPFATIEDLRRVRGIGAKTLDGLRPYLTVNPSR